MGGLKGPEVDHRHPGARLGIAGAEVLLQFEVPGRREDDARAQAMSQAAKWRDAVSSNTGPPLRFSCESVIRSCCYDHFQQRVLAVEQVIVESALQVLGPGSGRAALPRRVFLRSDRPSCLDSADSNLSFAKFSTCRRKPYWQHLLGVTAPATRLIGDLLFVEARKATNTPRSPSEFR